MSEALTVKPPTSLVAAGPEWSAIQEQARALIASGFFPKAVNTPAKAIAVMLAGRELGLPPMQSIRNVHIVDGKPTLSAETMLALAYQRVPGLTCEVKSGPDGAVVTGQRNSTSKPVTIAFTFKEAAAAGLMTKDNWRKYPSAMCRARAISAWCRVVAPDAILGCYTPEEVESIRSETRPAPAPVIDITSAQEVVDAQHVEPADDPRPTQEEAVQDEPGANDGPPGEPVISEKQKGRLWAITMSRAGALNIDKEFAKEKAEKALRGILGRHGFEHSADVTRSAYEQICKEAGEWTA